MSTLLPRNPVASRSARALAVAARPCCLRCSKRQGDRLGLVYEKVNTRRVYERCRRLNKPYYTISSPFPLFFTFVFNRILADFWLF